MKPGGVLGMLRWKIAQGRKPRVIIFGDSHTEAVRRAFYFKDRSSLYGDIEIYRIRKIKSGKVIGDIPLERFSKKIKALNEDDWVISLVGGNQYAMISTLRPCPDVYLVDPSEPSDQKSVACYGPATIIPRRAMKSYLASGIGNLDGAVLARIRASTRARVVHILPPPPKQDNEFIRRSHDTVFAPAGCIGIDPSEPQFRLKCWQLQRECLEELCGEIGIEVLPPPADTVDDGGFLKPFYYGKDVTHANRRYGDRLLREIARFT